jgi:tetratricopeptide (TPR) repeat protein
VTLGTILSVQGKYREAIDRLAKALQSDPASAEVRISLAEALRVSGRPAASLPHYQRAIELDPSVAEAWIGGAAALIALRRNDQARQWLLEARRVHPDHPKLVELMAAIR